MFVYSKMSAFTTHSYVERLEEDVASLKQSERTMGDRVVKMTAQMGKNRTEAKRVLEERDVEIAQLKIRIQNLKNENSSLETHAERLDGENNVLMKDYQTLVNKTDEEILNLQREVNSQHEFTEKIVSRAIDTENELIMKNGELQTQLSMLSEAYHNALQEKDAEISRGNDKQTNLSTQLEEKSNALNNCYSELNDTLIDLNRANEMLNAISSASSYINHVLSFKK